MSPPGKLIDPACVSLPSCLAGIHTSRLYVVSASETCTICPAAIIALFTAFDSLLNLVSVCTLFTFYIIACGILYRRYHLPGKTKPWLALFAILYFTAVSVGAPL